VATRIHGVEPGAVAHPRGPAIPDEYREEFEQETRQRTARAIWLVALITTPLWPLSSYMDYFIWGEHFIPLTISRGASFLGLVLLIVAQVVLRRMKKDAAASTVVVWAFVGIVGAYFTASSLIMGGVESDYAKVFALLHFVIFAAIPWPVGRMALILSVVTAAFLGVTLALDDNVQWGPSYVTFFLLYTTIFIGLFWTVANYRLRISEFLGRKNLEKERARSESLLLNILPEEIAEELKARGRVDAKHIDSCSILFTDFVGFTRVADRVNADALVASLDRVFSRFDEIVTRLGLEKLKTIGDAYMCAAGVTTRQPDHLLRCVLAGMEMLRVIEEEGVAGADGAPWRMRVGIHPGPVVAGVIGQKRFAFDLWGDTVNTASRLTATGQPQTINVATKVYRLVETFFQGVDRGIVSVRGKGAMSMTGLTRLRPEYAKDPGGRLPNEKFQDAVREWETSMSQPILGPATEAPGRPVPPDIMQTDPLSVLAELTVEDRKTLMGLSEIVAFDPGQIVVSQGQELKSLHLLVKGVAAVRVVREGMSVEVGLLQPGDVIGEMGFVSFEPASATVVALEPVVALRFKVEWMDRVAAVHPQTGMRLFQSLGQVIAQRVRDMNSRMVERSVSTMDGQTARTARRAVASAEVPPALEKGVREFKRQMDSMERARTQDPAAVAEACTRLVALAARCTGEADEADRIGIGAYFLRETFPFFMCSNTIERIATRAPGLQLDFPSAEAVFANQPRGHGAIGPQIDAWFLGWTLAASVRACQRHASDRIVEAYRGRTQEGPFFVSVVSCGSAPEVIDALHRLDRPENLPVTCHDPDLSALSVLGRTAAREGLSKAFTFVCEGLIRSGARRVRLAGQHMVCLPVLTEPVMDADFVGFLDEVHDGLEPGGAFVTGVLDLTPEALFLAESLLEWPVACVTGDRLNRFFQTSAFHRDDVRIREGLGGRGIGLVARRKA
jgi:class 3 adenylate cyclase/CRP-like cAMP-binding protein